MDEFTGGGVVFAANREALDFEAGLSVAGGSYEDEDGEGRRGLPSASVHVWGHLQSRI